MELDKFTKEELDELFEASFKVKEIMERYDNWRNLILDNQIYEFTFLNTFAYNCYYAMSRKFKMRTQKAPE